MVGWVDGSGFGKDVAVVVVSRDLAATVEEDG